jgi:hypothetical protein
MAGELHSPPDDGARARADDVAGEQADADALADRIAAYAPAGSDARVPVGSAREGRYRAALEFYAASVSYAPQNPPGTGSPIWRDAGKRAREALAPSEAEQAAASCANPYCRNGWVERGDNESGGAPAMPCGACAGQAAAEAAGPEPGLAALAGEEPPDLMRALKASLDATVAKRKATHPEPSVATDLTDDELAAQGGAYDAPEQR